ncbi:MAG: tetratricopeptide repeat protein [Acidobacteria bacterium]|nr:tetratricopeptide repeat protein [Acidobacteriota bacterium]
MSRNGAASCGQFNSGADLTARARWRGGALRLALVVALAVSAFVAASHETRAQIGGSGGLHTIYGDFKVDESKAGGMVPISFVLVLMTDTGNVVERQSVMNETRYRFLGLREGNYDIVVESAGMTVARIRVQLFALRKTEFKQDILLEWDRLPTGKSNSKKSGTVSTADTYERTPANRALFEKASGAMKKKKFDEAAALLQKIVEADPKDHLAWTDLGTMRYALGNNTEAERSYTRALSVRPDYLAAAVNLGRLHIATKNFDRAVEVLKPAVEKYPQSADANQLLGEAYLQIGKNDDAITHFNEAVRLDPHGKADAHLRIAMLHDAAGRKDKAAAELEQFLAVRPDHPDRQKFERYIKENKRQ